MTMVSTGEISLGGNATSGGLNRSVNIELGRAATATINMNETAVRTLAGVPSGAISMSNFYGKSNRVTSNITISANTSNYILDTAKAPGYVAGVTDVTLTINSGVFISSTSTGSYAFTVSPFASGDTVRIINNGTIVGRGGNGGFGNGRSFSGGTGGAGGPALLVNFPITLNNAPGRIAGGGGGGGGGASHVSIGGGGGGGGGIGGSTGGSVTPAEGQFKQPASPGSPGSPGTLTAAGPGGPGGPGNGPYPGGPGGPGGGYGSGGFGGSPAPNNSGGPGGSGGSAIVGVSRITFNGTGTINGAQTG